MCIRDSPKQGPLQAGHGGRAIRLRSRQYLEIYNRKGYQQDYHCLLYTSVASLWWAGQGSNKYFNFKSHETAHHFEAGLAYTLPLEKFPLSIAWYTMFAGADKNEKGEQNYSSYVELNYPFSIKSVDLNATCGFLPYEAGVGVYGVPNSGFAVTNLALKATKDIKVTDKFVIPIFVQAIWNPRMEDAHLVFGITLKP